MLRELGPAWKAVPPGDLKLRIGKSWGRAGMNEVFGLIVEMGEVGTIGKLHERNPFHLPCVRMNRANGVPSEDGAAT
jgi:hypothetical protein